jgi:hypothetical protein
MEINLDQNAIEIALKQYVTSLGLRQEVEQISFATSRKGGTSVAASITLSNSDLNQEPALDSPNGGVVDLATNQVTPSAESAATSDEPVPEENAAPTSMFGSA